ncbi:MAG: 23S rRNA (pseudouridine(1915)-N(3))-methyltransferase RlmH [Rhodospirillaceae bacterium TMED8]|nr:23S rRNA (pseudouridine(1915)-N(3))-methyltransferase RlmH [Magnetovibrio sp.]OUT49285.1 MAG: 23S rRNA (pseudouridine(1915)-N(3))-methyltransferase RlmH [Rhodospirillaceae bacterium TMED8]
MKYTIIAVGRWKSGPERDLFEHFSLRLSPPIELLEVEERRKLSVDELKNKEATLLLSAVPRGASIVALDGGGTMLSSCDLAKRIGNWRDQGVREIAWLIGGSNGLGDGVIARANLRLSLGLQTWPHLMVRAMVGEQLFRSQCILSGHPYHRE